MHMRSGDGCEFVDVASFFDLSPIPGGCYC